MLYLSHGSGCLLSRDIYLAQWLAISLALQQKTDLCCILDVAEVVGINVPL